MRLAEWGRRKALSEEPPPLLPESNPVVPYSDVSNPSRYHLRGSIPQRACPLVVRGEMCKVLYIDQMCISDQAKPSFL